MSLRRSSGCNTEKSENLRPVRQANTNKLRIQPGEEMLKGLPSIFYLFLHK
jgi:hypothetical protein